MASRLLKAWGYWVAGAATMLLAFWMLTRRLYGPAADELDE